MRQKLSVTLNLEYKLINSQKLKEGKISFKSKLMFLGQGTIIARVLLVRGKAISLEESMKSMLIKTQVPDTTMNPKTMVLQKILDKHSNSVNLKGNKLSQMVNLKCLDQAVTKAKVRLTMRRVISSVENLRLK